MADLARDAAAMLTLLREATSAAEEVNARHDMYGQVAMTVADKLNTSIAARMEELRVREREMADMEKRIATERARLAAEVTLDSLLDAFARRLASVTAERDVALAALSAAGAECHSPRAESARAVADVGGDNDGDEDVSPKNAGRWFESYTMSEKIPEREAQV